jgi:hypothetical protein
MKGTMLHVFSVGFDTLPELTPTSVDFAKAMIQRWLIGIQPFSNHNRLTSVANYGIMAFHNISPPRRTCTGVLTKEDSEG